jgi:hypothetical protein
MYFPSSNINLDLLLDLIVIDHTIIPNLDLNILVPFNFFNSFKSLDSIGFGLELILIFSISITILYSLDFIVFSAPSKLQDQPVEDMPTEQDLEDKIKEREEINDEHSKAGDDDDVVKEEELGLKLEDLDKQIEEMKSKLGK